MFELLIFKTRVVHGFLAPIQAMYYHLQPPKGFENTLELVNISLI
jgi:hypothetical protein